MSADFSTIHPQPHKRNGLAIASLVLGIISIPTLGLLGVGAIIALVLGSIALNRIKKDPATHSGKGMAIAGIITSAFSLLLTAVFCILIAIAVPKILENIRLAQEENVRLAQEENIRHTQESEALNSLRAIHNSEMTFNSVKSRFAKLKELWEAGFLDHNYMNGVAVNGYVYSSSDVSEKTYCVHAVRTDPAIGSSDFIICENGIIRYIESKTPGLVKRGEGAELGSSFYTR
jgi:type II secretory pathway pseudopilin PulG